MQHPGGLGVKLGAFKQLTLPAIARSGALVVPVIDGHHRLGQLRIKRQIVRIAAQGINRVAGPGFTGQHQCNVPRAGLGCHPAHAQDNRRGNADIEQAQRGKQLACKSPVRHDAFPAQCRKKRQGRDHRQDVAHQLGAGNGEEHRDGDDPDPAQAAPFARHRAVAEHRPRAALDLRQCKKHPREKKQSNGQQVQPPGLRVVEGAGGEAIKLLADEHVVQKRRVLSLRQRKPGHHNRGKQRQPAKPRQVQHLFELARPQQPDQQHQARQSKANQPLAEHAQATGHKAPACQPGVRPVAGHEGKPKAPDGHANPGGHQHVVVDVLAADQQRKAGAQHGRSAARNLLCGKGAGCQVEGCQHQARVQRRHQAQRPGVDAKACQRHRLQPVKQGWLVEERNAIEPGRQPVAALQHPAPDLAIAPLIGHRQGPQRGQHQQQRPQQDQHQPGLLAFAAFVLFGLLVMGVVHRAEFTNRRLWPAGRGAG